MNTATWSVYGRNKARLNAPLKLTDNRVLKAVEQLSASNDDLSKLLGAFRSTPLQPQAGIPIFGLVIASGIAILLFVVWLVFFDRGGIGGFSARLGVGGFIGMAVLMGISLGLMAFGAFKVRWIVGDLGQLLLVYENGVAHIRPDETKVYRWREIKEVRHQFVRTEYGGMYTGTEHAYTVVSKEGGELILLGRSYATRNNQPDDERLTDVEQVGNFVKLNVNAG